MRMSASSVLIVAAVAMLAGWPGSATAHRSGCMYEGREYSDGAFRDGQICRKVKWENAQASEFPPYAFVVDLPESDVERVVRRCSNEAGCRVRIRVHSSDGSVAPDVVIETGD